MSLTEFCLRVGIWQRGYYIIIARLNVVMVKYVVFILL